MRCNCLSIPLICFWHTHLQLKHVTWNVRTVVSCFVLLCLYYEFPVELCDLFNTLRPWQNGRHFADDIFTRIFVNENLWIPIKISLKFVPRGSINNMPALIRIMAWCRPGDKPLSEPMMVNSPTYICVTRPPWVNRILQCWDPLCEWSSHKIYMGSRARYLTTPNDNNSHIDWNEL